MTLLQTAKSITPSFLGVSADILGIRIGMTVSQAEAIAAKSYPGKPQEMKTTYTSRYRDISVRPILTAPCI